MIYVITALHNEAKVLIENFNLKKEENKIFPIYKNEKILLIISSIGAINAASATTYLFTRFSPRNEDIFLNIGIAAGKKDFNIGDIVEVTKVVDSASKKVFHLNSKTDLKKVSCLTLYEEANRYKKCDIADMESSGIIISAKRFNIKPIIIKIISDHFEPKNVDKNSIDKLILKNIKKINEILN